MSSSDGGKNNCASDAASQLDALYAEVDLTKKRQQRCASSGSTGLMSSPIPSSTGGGLGLSGPVSSMMQQRFPDSSNRLSLSGLTRSARDSRVDSGSVDMETPISLSPKSPVVDHNLHHHHHQDQDGHSPASGMKKPIPPPRTRLPRKDSVNGGDHSVNGSASSGGSAALSDHSGASSSSCVKPGQCPSLSTLSGLSDAETFENGGPTTALGELGQAIDQAIASMTAAASEHSDYDVPKPPRSLKMRPRMLSNEVHDYAEIYTPSKERVPWNAAASSSSLTSTGAPAAGYSVARHSSSHPGSLAGSASSDPDHYQHDDGKPPTPPLHRFPSWESRIYQAAADGFSLSEQVPSTTTINSLAPPTQPGSVVQHHGHNNQHGHHGHSQHRSNTQRLSASGSIGYQDISIPVYATVKGVSVPHSLIKQSHELCIYELESMMMNA